MKPPAQCGQCRFYEARGMKALVEVEHYGKALALLESSRDGMEEREVGVCRRRAPVMVGTQGTTFVQWGTWPWVMGETPSCGEFAVVQQTRDLNWLYTPEERIAEALETLVEQADKSLEPEG